MCRSYKTLKNKFYDIYNALRKFMFHNSVNPKLKLGWY